MPDFEVLSRPTKASRVRRMDRGSQVMQTDIRGWYSAILPVTDATVQALKLRSSRLGSAGSPSTGGLYLSCITDARYAAIDFNAISNRLIQVWTSGPGIDNKAPIARAAQLGTVPICCIRPSRSGWPRSSTICPSDHR